MALMLLFAFVPPISSERPEWHHATGASRANYVGCVELSEPVTVAQSHSCPSSSFLAVWSASTSRGSS